MSFPVMWGGPQIQGAPSLIENQQPFGQQIPQHFVEWFSGDALDTIWNQLDTQGSATFAMVDAIDEGFSITCGAGLNDSSQINFNGINHYDPSGLENIAWVRSMSIVQQEIDHGLRETLTGHRITFSQKNNSSTFTRTTTNGGSDNIQNSSKTSDTLWHKYRFKLDSISARFYIDDDFENVHTTQLPTDGLQPRFRVANDTAAAKEGRMRYFEVWNTEA